MASSLTPQEQQLLEKIVATNIASQRRLAAFCIGFGLAAIPMAIIIGYALNSPFEAALHGMWLMLAMLFLGTARFGYARLYEIIQKLHDAPSEKGR